MNRFGLGQLSQYNDLVNSAAAKYGLDPALITAVIQVESNGNPNARGSQGELGLMQLMPGTAASLGVTNPFDPAQNIDAGSRYLAQMINQFGSIDAGLAAYNWGSGNMSRGAPIPPGVQDYVSKVLSQAGAGQVATPAPTIPASNGGPLIDLSGAAASTPTADILNQMQGAVPSVDTGTGAILATLGIAAAAWLISR
jgi:soluble lytic murein transglycosylase-like protein